jgi:hypothetical protein
LTWIVWCSSAILGNQRLRSQNRGTVLSTVGC